MILIKHVSNQIEEHNESIKYFVSDVDFVQILMTYHYPWCRWPQQLHQWRTMASWRPNHNSPMYANQNFQM